MTSTVATADATDDDIEIIEVKQTPTKANIELIEIVDENNCSPVTPQQRARKTFCSPIAGKSFGDSPINVNKRVNKRVFIDDEDSKATNGFGVSSKKPKTDTTIADVISAKYAPNDEIGKLAFEDMCESAIAELSSLFPEIDICEIQDVLIECEWSVFNASVKLGNLAENNNADDEVTVVDNDKDSSSTGNNNEKMKSMNFYRKSPLKSDEPSNAGSSNIKSIKNFRNQFLKRIKLKEVEIEINDSDDEEDGGGGDSGGEEYCKDDIVDISSGDDSDDYRKASKSKAIIRIKVSDLREKVVTFFQEANSFELQTISGVSGKKIDAIINMRPFTDWDTTVMKFRNHNNLSTDVLNNCCEVIKARENVDRLMNACEEIANDISLTVDKLTALEQPKILNSELSLANYQLIGLNWLVLMYQKNLNAILADEMGLGKTIQVIAFLAYLREVRNIAGPHLIIVPSSTLDNWSREIQTWCECINILLYYGSQGEREELRKQIFANTIDYDVIITTYNMAYSAGDRALFKRKVFKYVVFDEAHMLKNMRSNRFTGLMKIKAKHRLLLTGTPLQNNLVELMSLLIFTMPHMFYGKTDDVKALFTYSNRDSSDRVSYINDRIQQAKKIMKPFVLRRLKCEVLKELPLKIEHKCVCPMSASQELKYMELIENYTREIKYRKITFEDENDLSEEKYQKGAGMLMMLRKAANHPLLLRTYYTDPKLKQMSQLMLKEPTHRDANPQLIFEDMQVMHDFELHRLCKQYKTLNSYKLEVDLVLDSGKFQELDSLLTKYRFEGKRVLLFSQFVIMLDIIEEYMKLRYYKFLRLDGSTKVADRLELIDKFNDDQSYFIFLLSTRAGGLGINLTAASVVIIHDIDFNPYNDQQAEDRCHRIGQTQEVIVYRLISQNTVEEGILGIAEEKLKLGRDLSDDNQNKDKGNDNKEEQIEKSDVKTLLRAALKL